MIRYILLTAVLALPVSAQVPVPEVPGLPPELAAQIRKDIAQINQLPLGLQAFPTEGVTTTSSSDEWSMVNDKFRLKFSDNGTMVKVSGKVAEGKAVLDEIVLQEGKAAEKTVSKLDEMPMPVRKRLVEILEQKLAR